MQVSLPWSKSRWLSAEVAAAKRRLFEESGARVEGTIEKAWRKLREGLDSLWGYLAIPAVIVACHAILIAPPAWQIVSSSTALDWIRGLWPAQVGLVSATFVIVFFIVQAVHRGEPHERVFDRFLALSNLRPIASLAFSSIVALSLAVLILTVQANERTPDPGGASNLVFLDGGLFVATVLAAMRLYWVTFKFVRPGELFKLSVATAEDEVSASLDKELEERLAHAILDQYCKQTAIRYRWFGASLAPKPTKAVFAPTDGEVADIDLHALSAVVGHLRDHVGSDANGTMMRAELYVGLGSRVNQSEPLIRVADADHTEKLAAELRAAFRLAAPSEKVPDARWSVDWTRDLAVRGLSQGDSHAFQAALDAFEGLLEAVRERARAFGLIFTPDVAERMLAFEWRTLYLIEGAIREIISAAFRSGPMHLFLDALYWPTKLARAAMDSGDFRAYREALALCPAMYVFARQCVDPDKRRLGVDRAGQRLFELGALDLVPRIERARSAVAVQRLTPHARLIVTTFNTLLKFAADERDAEASRGFVRKMASFPGIIPGVPAYESERLRLEMIENTERRQDEERDLERRLALTRLVDDLAILERGVLLGWASWSMARYASNATSPEFVSAAVETTRPYFDSLRALCETVLAAFDNEWDETLRWDSWDLEERERKTELEAVWVAPERWLVRFYCLHGLRLTPDADAAPTLPHSVSAEKLLAFVREGCARLVQERDVWKDLLSDDDLKKEEAFVEAHELGLQRQRRDEEDWLIAQPISQSKWEEFIGGLLQNWAEGVALRPFFDSAGRVSVVEGPAPADPTIRRIASPTWLPKGAFVEGGHVVLMRYAGQDFAREENQYVAEVLAERISPKRIVPLDKVQEAIEDAVKQLNLNGFAASLIIVGGGWEIDSQLIRSPSWLWPRARAAEFATLPRLHGWLGELPVVQLWEAGEDIIMVVDTAQVGKLEHFCGREGELFQCTLREFGTGEAVADLIKEVPRVRRDKKGRFRPMHEIKREFGQRVHLTVSLDIRFKITQPMAGICIPVRVPRT